MGMKYNVVIPVPDEVHPALDRIVENIDNHLKSRHVRGHRHVTLFRFYGEDMDVQYSKLLEQVNVYAGTLKSLSHLAVFDGEPMSGCVVVPLEGAGLGMLHQRVAETLNHMRMRQECRYTMCKDAEQVHRREVCGEFGSPFYGHFYMPHITLGKLLPGADEKNISEVPVQVSWFAERFELWKRSGCAENDGCESVASFPFMSV